MTISRLIKSIPNETYTSDITIASELIIGSVAELGTGHVNTFVPGSQGNSSSILSAMEQANLKYVTKDHEPLNKTKIVSGAEANGLLGMLT